MIHDISSVERHILVRNSVYIPFSMLHDRQGEFKSLLNLLQANTKGTDQNVRIRAVFNLSKVITQLLCFCIVTVCDWLKNLTPLSRPIRSKTKINRDLPARVFPRLAPATCICFEL